MLRIQRLNLFNLFNLFIPSWGKTQVAYKIAMLFPVGRVVIVKNVLKRQVREENIKYTYRDTWGNSANACVRLSRALGAASTVAMVQRSKGLLRWLALAHWITLPCVSDRASISNPYLGSILLYAWCSASLSRQSCMERCWFSVDRLTIRLAGDGKWPHGRYNSFGPAYLSVIHVTESPTYTNFQPELFINATKCRNLRIQPRMMLL